jgi:UDP-glucuronate 4-epimerase
MRVLVTGVAGFIGYHLTDRLLREGVAVDGLDIVNDYYDVRLKEARLARLEGRPGYRFHRVDLADRAAMEALFAANRYDRVVHLAAQAGVRYSLTNPHAYIQSNLVGQINVLEGCRHGGVGHLIYASSSSVYGSNVNMPFSEHDGVDHPLSLYAATKKADELMSHSYSHMYGLPTTGLRFFTVYGPWGRPDMALFLFTRAILAGQPIDVFNHGDMRRDFTYVDDIVEGIVRLLRAAPPAPDPGWSREVSDPATSAAPYRVFNIGNHTPVPLMELIATLEQSLGRRAEIRYAPMQIGDVPATFADVDALTAAVGWRPSTSISEGVPRFVEWYRSFYGG